MHAYTYLIWFLTHQLLFFAVSTCYELSFHPFYQKWTFVCFFFMICILLLMLLHQEVTDHMIARSCGNEWLQASLAAPFWLLTCFPSLLVLRKRSCDKTKGEMKDQRCRNVLNVRCRRMECRNREPNAFFASLFFCLQIKRVCYHNLDRCMFASHDVNFNQQEISLLRGMRDWRPGSPGVVGLCGAQRVAHWEDCYCFFSSPSSRALHGIRTRGCEGEMKSKEKEEERRSPAVSDALKMLQWRGQQVGGFSFSFLVSSSSSFFPTSLFARVEIINFRFNKGRGRSAMRSQQKKSSWRRSLLLT